jgi:hypothetical protein
LEAGTRQVQSLLQTLNGLELDVSEALGGLGQLVLHNTDICHTTSSEKVGDISLGGFEGKVADVASVGRLGRKIERLPDGVSTTLALCSLSDLTLYIRCREHHTKATRTRAEHVTTSGAAVETGGQRLGCSDCK